MFKNVHILIEVKNEIASDINAPAPTKSVAPTTKHKIF